MEHLKMQSPNIVSDNMAYIAKRWPECLTEAKDENGKLRQVIDFDKLRQALSSDATGEGQERYQFTWPDKRHAIRMANTPTTSTLRPCREDSIDFDNTQNLYIEGDNLEVLKLLRESYLSKVKMIYIDPPYNTGGDFVYKDNFIKRNSDYAEVSGAYDEEGNQIASEFEKNADTNGRFHTDWLNMIYPRLKVARDLLTEDGVIFISIDDNEVHNLRKVCDEVFGEKNFVAEFNWRKKTGANDAKDIAIVTEAILLYAKNHEQTIKEEIWKRDEDSIDQDRYNLTDEFVNERGKFYYDTLDRGGLQYSDSLNYGIEAPDGGIIYPNGRDSFVNDGWIWKWNKEKVKWGLENKFVSFVKSSKSKGSAYTIKYKVYQLVDNEGWVREKSGRAFMNLILNPINQIGNKEMKNLFEGGKPFSNPKPIGLIKFLLDITKTTDALVLDFFSGSATTAHAVMQLNAEDGGNRKYIMVQLPEVTDEKSEAHKAGYKNICEIGKERIRRAGKKIKEEHPDWKGDTGFRVLKVDSSNMEDVFYTPAATDMRNLFADNIKADRTDEDLLLQVMMELGIALSEKIEKIEIAGKTVWNVKQGYLMACFEPNVSEDTITAIAKQQPQYFVMADRSLASDNVADNFEQLFEEYSPTTIRRIL